MRLLRRDISITVTEPNTEELEVAAVLSLVLVLVARVEELPDILNLDLQSHFVRSNISRNPWGAPDLKHKHLSPASVHPQDWRSSKRHYKSEESEFFHVAGRRIGLNRVLRADLKSTVEVLNIVTYPRLYVANFSVFSCFHRLCSLPLRFWITACPNRTTVLMWGKANSLRLYLSTLT